MADKNYPFSCAACKRKYHSFEAMSKCCLKPMPEINSNIALVKYDTKCRFCFRSLPKETKAIKVSGDYECLNHHIIEKRVKVSWHNSGFAQDF